MFLILDGGVVIVMQPNSTTSLSLPPLYHPRMLLSTMRRPSRSSRLQPPQESAAPVAFLRDQIIPLIPENKRGYKARPLIAVNEG